MLAAVAAVALGVAIYKIAKRSSEAEKAQKRLGDTMADMNKEAIVERSRLVTYLNRLNELRKARKNGTRQKTRLWNNTGISV